MKETSVKEITKESDTLIVSFGCKRKQFGSILPFEFLNFLEAYYPNVSKLFIIDIAQNSYHSGIERISTTINETSAYLREKIKSYKYVYFMGVSAGGYASILFGSLLNVTAVIAFVPQTFRNAMALPNNYVNPEYADLKPLINTVTKYYLYADSSVMDKNNCHHMSHCTRLSIYSNVTINIKNTMSLPTMRDSGELFEIINNILISNQN